MRIHKYSNGPIAAEGCQFSSSSSDRVVASSRFAASSEVTAKAEASLWIWTLFSESACAAGSGLHPYENHDLQEAGVRSLCFVATGADHDLSR